MEPVKYLLHCRHRYCTVDPGVAWVDAARVAEAKPCPACRRPVLPHKIEDLERIRGLRFGGSSWPRLREGDNTLADPLSSDPLTD